MIFCLHQKMFMGFFSNFTKKLMRGSILTKQLKLVWHIESGGKIIDENGRALLCELVQVALKDPEIAKVARYHNLSVDDISVLIAAGVIELDPESIITYGGTKLLVPVIVLIEWKMLDTAFAIINREAHGQTPEERRKGIINYSASCMGDVKAAIAKAV